MSATYGGWVLAAIALAGCLQSAANPCDNGGICSAELHCGMAGAVQVCVPLSCGNGRIDPGEACDDGNTVSGDGCPADCSLVCGDGIVDPGEACDESNAIEGDGCDSNCTLTACGNAVVDPSEVCDDGNLTDGDGCDSNCTLTACGNAVIDPGEVCDDGNASDGDGCDRNCTLTCFPVEPTVEVSPADGTAAPAGVPFHIDFAITNHNPAPCAPSSFSAQYSFFSHRGGARFTVVPPSGDAGTIPSGATGHFVITVTPDPMDYPSTGFDLNIFLQGPRLTYATGKSFVVGEPPGCHVSIARSLLIKAIPVITDPVRTVFDPRSSDPRNGAWSFQHLMEAAASSPADAPAMIEAMLQSYTVPQTVNGFVIAPRPAIRQVLNRWPRTANGALDLARAPLSLEAIVNRFDLRDPAGGDAGELEFELAFRERNFPLALDAMLLLRYKVPVASPADVPGWARAFHDLATRSAGEDYNAALQSLTEHVVRRGAWPGRPNDSALVEVQSWDTEFDFARSPGMRAFALSPSSGRLEPVPLALSPDQSFNHSATLASFLQNNRTAILAGTYTVPMLLDGAPFQGAATALDFSFWSAPGVDPEVRYEFAKRTCQGCHGAEISASLTRHMLPRSSDREPDVSGYLTGMTVEDPATSESRYVNELFRRAMDMKPLVCPDEP